MNYQMTSLAALSVLALSACAPRQAVQPEVAADPNCSVAKSAANDASCTGGKDLGAPVVDISKPAPAPGVAAPVSSKP